jgi:hypothetical protein
VLAGTVDQRTDFTAARIAIEKMDGTVVKERLHPSEHAEGKAVDTPWDVLDRASTKRRAYMRDDRLMPTHDRLMVSIDLSDIVFS